MELLSNPMLLSIIIIAVLVIGTVIFFILGKKKGSGSEGSTSKTSSAQKLKIKKITQSELFQSLVASDFGSDLSKKIVEQVENQKQDLKTVLFNELFLDKSKELNLSSHPAVLLFVGVNGVGKTTSIGKVAYRLKNEKNKVLLIAADTFRAAATEQLTSWANEIGVDIETGKEKQDPSSVIFSGLQRAKSDNYDVVLIDTAGRLQNKSDLMDELGKIVRTIKKQTTLNEVILVVDANNGQNVLSQAKIFDEVTHLSAFIITKIDSSTKGGTIINLVKNFQIPVKFLGTGEKPQDLKIFDEEEFIASLL